MKGLMCIIITRYVSQRMSFKIFIYILINILILKNRKDILSNYLSLSIGGFLIVANNFKSSFA